MAQDHPRCNLADTRVSCYVCYALTKRVLLVLVGMTQILGQGSIEIESVVLHQLQNAVSEDRLAQRRCLKNGILVQRYG